MRNQILSATKIKTKEQLENIPPKGIENAIWKTQEGKVQCGQLNRCDCGSIFSVNTVWVLSGVNTRGWEGLDIEECSYNADTEKCNYCPN